MKLVALCNITTIVTGTQVFVKDSKPYSMNSSIPKPKQLHSCTVRTSDNAGLLSCFAHDLMWRARQLVHAGDHSKHQSLERLDTERPRGVKFVYRRQSSP